MTEFYAEHSTLSGLLMLAGLAMMFGWLSLTIRLIQVRNFRKYTAVSVGFTLLSFAFYIMLRIRLEIMPVLLLICGFAVQTVLLTLAAWMVRRQTGSQLSSMSFKEAFDTLPTGLCFYQEGGMPRLVNLQMEYLCRRITGAHLSNAEEFFWYLREGNCSGSVTGGESPIICLSDGTAFCFTHHLLEYQGEMLHELIAADITEQYQMTLEMERKQKQIRLINKRLRALNSTMRFIIMEKEVLSLKTKIHDELGKALLLCRRYLMHPEEAAAEEIRAQWRVSFGLLLNEKRETWQKPYLINTKQATLLGVKLEVEGDLPEEEHLIRVVDTAMTVHITNVLRHAEGDRAKITVESYAGYYILRITNNGRPPVRGVRESGGLFNLRHMAERIGGGMKIRSLPAYELSLRLPKQKPEGIL